MSGGHFEFSVYQLDELADNIERDFLNDGKYQTEDWSAESDFRGNKPMMEADRISDANEVERPIILKEVKILIEDLKKLSKRIRELDLYMSGDTGATTYLERLEKAGLIKMPEPVKIKSTKELTHCCAARDGECFDDRCPQLRDNEPEKSGRNCPLLQYDDED